MRECEVVDLVGDAFVLLERNARLPVDQQLDAWADYYGGYAPDLLAKCIGCYESDSYDWRDVARQYVWPKLPANMDKMKAGRRSARRVSRQVYARAAEVLGLDLPLLFVIYVGIGCGAGWATWFRGRRAVLIGLENVAEHGYQEPSKMKGLLAHEIGHIFMYDLREGEPDDLGDPFCRLFDEGFAQQAEHLIFGEPTWHCAWQEGWLEWCREKEGYLARRFLADRGDPEEARRFFASWFDVDGWCGTGYYLGCRLVEHLERERSMRELARLSPDEIKEAAERYLKSLSRKRG